MFPHNKRAAYALISKLSLALIAGAALAVTSESFANPGDLYVTELATGSVVVYTPEGAATTFDTGLTNPQGIAFDQAKNLYVVDAGDGSPGAGTIFKYDLGGGSSSKTPFQTGLNNPQGLVLDGSDLLVSEKGADRVLRVPLDGIHPPMTFQTISGPLGLASRGINNGPGIYRYIANGPIVRELLPDGSITEYDFSADGSRAAAVAPNPGDAFISTDTGNVFNISIPSGVPEVFASGFTQPTGMDFRPAKFSGDTDRVGFLYVADTATNVISQISASGTVTPFVTGAGMPNYLVFERNGPPADTARNLSTRVDVETGDEVGIGGFIITGGTLPKNVAIRAIGPSLAAPPFNVPGTLANPTLELHEPDGTVLTNDDWKTNSAADQATIVSDGLNMIGGNLISDSESILLATLPPKDPAVPGSGEYTAIVSGVGGGTGIGLVEVYDLDDPSAVARLANLSTRGLVGTDDRRMIGGVIIGPEGGTDASVVVRAIGPSLANNNPPVPNPLLDPVLELRNENADLIAMNDNWMENSAEDQATLTNDGLAPTNDLESAIVADLIAGLYTAIVSGKDGTTGVGLVEIYHIAAVTGAGN